jgi:acyl carrier protein
VAGDETLLQDLGLDSLELAALIVELEQEYGVSFPADMMTREVFSSVASVTDAVRRLHAARSSGR